MEKNFIGKYEYLVIEGKVLNDTKLTGNEKLFYSLIVNLSLEKGYCFATNAKLSEMIQTFICKCDTRQVTNYLKKLKVLNYIKIDMTNGRRRIYPVTLQAQNIANQEIFEYDWLNNC